MDTERADPLPEHRGPAPGRAGEEPPSGLARTNSVRSLWLCLALAVLAATAVLSVAVGTRFVPPETVWQVLWHPDGSEESVIVHGVRLPRTALGLAAGTALGLAGALIMALTRNPLADPGILGVNAGAMFAVTLAVAFLGLNAFHQYVWFAFAGAVTATVAVYLIGSSGRGGATPVRLTLAGVALGAVLSGISSGIALLDPRAFDVMRHWFAGSLSGRDMEVVGQTLPFLGIGVLVALALARPLNAVALGDDLAAAMGVHMAWTRFAGVVAVTLLCGTATAAAGPIGFVGLMVPHVARWLLGPDQRWVFVFTALAAPALLLASDIVGRLVIRPAEIEVGVVTAFVGAPVLIALVRRRKASGL